MKRFIAVLLMVVLLVGCGKQEPVAEAETEPSTEPPTTVATEPPTEATEPTTEATEPEPTEPPVIRNPLTGEVLDTPYTGRITAVVVNNIKACQPQHGISQADIFYEIEAEGGITRNLALFTSLDNIEKVGPIRSARTFFNSLAAAYNAPLVHCGAGGPAKTGSLDRKGSHLDTWEHVDANAYGSDFFYRDQARLSQGFALEHTLFSTGEKLQNVLAYKEFDMITEDGVDMAIAFNEEPVLDGEEVYKMTVTFKYSKTTSFTYDAETGLFTAHQYGSTHTDGNTNEPVTYRNVMALYTTHNHEKLPGSSVTRSFYQLLGDGEGVLACDGKLIPIRWQRSAHDAPFTYTLEDGTPLELGVGRTYIAITGASEPLSYE